MTRLTIILLLLTLKIACGAVPRLFQEKDFTSASFAEAVNYFVALGEDAAVVELRGLATGPADSKLGFSLNERIGWMCRVLFEAKAGSLRAPRFGALNLPYHTMPDTSWPLYPVALSGSTYFVLSQGYSGTGIPEDLKAYIQYCRQTGTFRNKPVTVPTKARAIADAATLRQSAAWLAIKWKDSGTGWSCSMSEEWAWDFVQRQAESIR